MYVPPAVSDAIEKFKITKIIENMPAEQKRALEIQFLPAEEKEAELKKLEYETMLKKDLEVNEKATQRYLQQQSNIERDMTFAFARQRNNTGVSICSAAYRPPMSDSFIKRTNASFSRTKRWGDTTTILNNSMMNLNRTSMFNTSMRLDVSHYQGNSRFATSMRVDPTETDVEVSAFISFIGGKFLFPVLLARQLRIVELKASLLKAWASQHVSQYSVQRLIEASILQIEGKTIGTSNAVLEDFLKFENSLKVQIFVDLVFNHEDNIKSERSFKNSLQSKGNQNWSTNAETSHPMSDPALSKINSAKISPFMSKSIVEFKASINRPVKKNQTHFMLPSFEDISQMTDDELASVHKFAIWNKFARIEFKEPVDLRNANFDTDIYIGKDEVTDLNPDCNIPGRHHIDPGQTSRWGQTQPPCNRHYVWNRFGVSTPPCKENQEERRRWSGVR